MKFSRILSLFTAATVFLSMHSAALAFNFNLGPSEPNWVIVENAEVEVGTLAEFTLINTNQSDNNRTQYGLPEGWSISMEELVDSGQWPVANNDQIEFDQDRRVFTYAVPEKAGVYYYSIELLDENGGYITNSTFEPIYNPTLFGIESSDQRLIPGADYTVTTYSDATNQPATMPKGWGMKLEFQDGQFSRLTSNRFLGEENGQYTFEIPDTATEMLITIYNALGAQMDSQNVEVTGAVPVRITSGQEVYASDAGMAFYLYNDQDQRVDLPEGWDIAVYGANNMGYASTDGGGADIGSQIGNPGYYYINFLDNWGTEGQYSLVVEDEQNQAVFSSTFRIGQNDQPETNYNLSIPTGGTYDSGQTVRVAIQTSEGNQSANIPEAWQLRLLDAENPNAPAIYSNNSGMTVEGSGTYSFPAPAIAGEYWIRLVEADGSTHVTFRINVRSSLSQIQLEKSSYPLGQDIYFSLLDNNDSKVKLSYPLELEVAGPNGVIRPTYNASSKQYKIPAQQSTGEYEINLDNISGANVDSANFSVVEARMLAKITNNRIYLDENLRVTIYKSDQSNLNAPIRLQIYNEGNERIANIGNLSDQESLVISDKGTSLTVLLPISAEEYSVGKYTVKILNDSTGNLDDFKTFNVVEELPLELADQVLRTGISGLNFNSVRIVSLVEDDSEDVQQQPAANDDDIVIEVPFENISADSSNDQEQEQDPAADPIQEPNFQEMAPVCEDMNESHWAKALINELVYREQYPLAIQDDAVSCRPGADLSRERALAWILLTYYPEELQNLAQINVDELSFPDVDKNGQFAPYIKVGSDLGIMVGNGDGTFKPQETIKRSELLAIILRAKGIDFSNEQLDPAFSPEQKYADYSPNAWYNNTLHYATQEAIIVGRANSNGNLRLAAMNDAIRYAEAAVLFDLVLFQ